MSTPYVFVNNSSAPLSFLPFSPTARYIQRPTFGSSDAVLPRLFGCKHCLRMYHTSMHCKHAQLAVLLHGVNPTKVCVAGRLTVDVIDLSSHVNRRPSYSKIVLGRIGGQGCHASQLAARAIAEIPEAQVYTRPGVAEHIRGSVLCSSARRSAHRYADLHGRPETS